MRRRPPGRTRVGAVAMHEVVAMMSDWLMHYLAHSVVALTIVGAVAWMGDRLLRRVGPQAQHRIWVVALLAGVALPLLPTAGLARYFTHADASAAGGTVAVTYSMAAATTALWALTTRLAQMLAGAYLLTVLFSMMRLLWRWRRTRAMVRRSAVLPLGSSACGASACGLVQDAARRFGVVAPEVRCSSKTRGPVVLGLRRAVLLVPDGFFAVERLGPEYQEDASAALAHECAHIARRDYAKNLFYECVAAAVAYHPVSWMMRRRIAETRELVCDEMAAHAVGDRPEYAASLLRLATAMAGPAARPFYASETQAIGVLDAGILEERVMRLTMDLPKVTRARKIAMAVVASCALLGGAATAAALSFDVTPQDGAITAPAHEKVYKVGDGVTPPVLTHAVDAEFPDARRKAGKKGLEGVSVVGLVVDSKGAPRDIHIARSLAPDFDKAAMDAVRQYKFEPGMRNGKAVAVAINIEVNFRRY
jgi:bla regulator protein blaR1